MVVILQAGISNNQGVHFHIVFMVEQLGESHRNLMATLKILLKCVVVKKARGRMDGSLKQSSNFVKTCAVVTNTAHLQPLFLLNVIHVGVPLESLVSYEQFGDNWSITFKLFQISIYTVFQ